MEKQLQVTVTYVFLKGNKLLLNLLKERPQLANWWSDMETKHKAKFRNK